jgi:MFS family permease
VNTFSSTFRSLRHRNYRLYFLGQLVSLLGTWMQATALTWLAFELTHENKWTNWITAAQIAPTFFLGLWGGTLADRWAKRSLIIATQSAFLMLALLLVVLTLGRVITPWQLLAVAAANGLVQAIDVPARLAFVMDMTGREDLINAVGLNSVLFNVARALGPALAGFVLYWIEPWACFLCNALSYVAVIWALALMDITGSTDGGIRNTGWRALVSGFRFLGRHRELGYLVLLAGSVSFFGWPSQALLPAVADKLGFQHGGYSLLLSGTGVGALASAWAIATFGSAQLRDRLIVTGVAGVSAALVGLSFAGNLMVASACCALLGFGLILFLATSQSVMQLGSGEHNRGVLMGIWAVTLSGAVPLGNLLAGPAADKWGASRVLFWQGVACATVALALLALFRMTAMRGQGALEKNGQANHSPGGIE